MANWWAPQDQGQQQTPRKNPWEQGGNLSTLGGSGLPFSPNDPTPQSAPWSPPGGSGFADLNPGGQGQPGGWSPPGGEGFAGLNQGNQPIFQNPVTPTPDFAGGTNPNLFNEADQPSFAGGSNLPGGAYGAMGSGVKDFGAGGDPQQHRGGEDGLFYPGGSATFDESAQPSFTGGAIMPGVSTATGGFGTGNFSPVETGGSAPPTSGSGGYAGAGSTGTPPPQAGQFQNNIQGFIEWATQKYGADPTRGSGFINAQSGGGLQNMLKAYASATGNTANYLGGPSGDRVDFGAGVQDALTSGGQVWNGSAVGGAPSGGQPSFGGGGPMQGAYGLHGGDAPSFGAGGNLPGGAYGPMGGGGNINLPPPPQLNQLQAPGPFSYQPMNLGQFQGPSPYQAPSPFQYGGNVPGAPNLQAQNVADPERLNYQQYNGLTEEQLKSDPSYKFRFDQGAEAASNIIAHSGALRTGNAAKALTDYGQNAASQEYAAADARARQNVQGNNANAYQFGNANNQNQFQATQANNQNAFNFGNQNFQNALAGQGQGYGQAANSYGMNAATQQGAQNQNFSQALAGYQANLGAQNQGYNQALGAYQTNANTGLAYGSQNQNNALANYQAQVNAQLGLGNLNLGFQNANQNYALGQGNLALGYQNSNNQYALGQGQLGLGYGNLNLQQQGQNFNQGLQSWQQNYQANVLDPWNMQMQLAQLGNPGAPNGQGNANAQGDLYTQIGNANASGQIGSANAWNGWWNNIGNLAGQIPSYYGGGGGSYTPGIGQPPYA